jgi:hypothetical protein
MYKNFIITESDKKEILNMLRENGYGKPLNENEDMSMDDHINYDINDVDCDGEDNGGSMRIESDDEGNPIAVIRYCKGDVDRLEYLKRKARREIEMSNKLPSHNEDDLEELDHAGFHDRDDLQVLRDAIDRNKMVSVAFVKKDGTVRHMLVRKSLKSYVGSDAEKTDAQMNVEANNDLKKVVDINAYKRELKRLRNDNPEMNPDEMKTMAAKTCWRSISLKNVLGFMVSGQFIDLRDENDIMGRFGEEVNNSLTRSMVNAMNQEVAQEEEPEMENEPQAPEPGQENPEENPDGPINESLMKIRSEFKRFL